MPVPSSADIKGSQKTLKKLRINRHDKLLAQSEVLLQVKPALMAKTPRYLHRVQGHGDKANTARK